jgi:hypothetical protein
MRPAARLHSYKTGRKVHQTLQQLRPGQAVFQYHLPVAIHPDDMKDGLAHVDANDSNVHLHSPSF